MTFIPADSPILPGRRYRATFHVRGLAWGTDWVVNRAKERVWDELQRRGLRLLAWEFDGDSFTVTFDKVAPTKDGGLTVAIIGIALAATLLLLALTISLDKVEELFTPAPGGGAGVSAVLGVGSLLLLLVLGFVLVQVFRRAG